MAGSHRIKNVINKQHLIYNIISKNIIIIITFVTFRYTYPHTRSGICVVTQSNPEVSEFIKLITFMLPEVTAGIIILCLHIYRIFVKKEKISSIRIFLRMALILFLIVNALFKSHLSFLLTMPVYKRDIEGISRRN